MDKYNTYIYELFKNIPKNQYDNIELSKIFEYYVCIQLTTEFNRDFFEYFDIDPTFKEDNHLSKNDTGIDCCDLQDTIVQCKLRKEIGWTNMGTFFASQNCIDKHTGKLIIRWPNLILARNDNSLVSDNLKFQMNRLNDKLYDKNTLIEYCNNLLKNPPKCIEITSEIILRDYQLEAIELINNKQNIIINLPTGTGKNIIIINSFKKNEKYLILVPRIILMEQIEEEIKKYKPKIKIQKYGDNSKKTFDIKKDVTICVYNSVELIKEHYEKFNKIYIDEAHHILKPIIYTEEDEEEAESTTYIGKIRELSKYNNNVLLSATIDEQEGYLYYSKDIRDMIDLGYLTDYTINIPIFPEEPDNKNICNYLIQKYMYIIIYCNSKKEGKLINSLMNKIQPNSSKYIDCDSTKTERKRIILDYKNGFIPFLVNVRVLIEGFDAPITRGVCFMHLPSSKQTIIQTIGRCLRKHSLKKYAKVILPYATEDDEKAIGKFLKILATNDKRIRKSYEEKNFGGYIDPIIVTDDDEERELLESKYDLIYSKCGILMNYIETYNKRLDELKEYIDKYEKRPSRKDEDKYIIALACWVESQVTNYNQLVKNMKNSEIKKIWEDFTNDPKYSKFFNIKINRKSYKEFLDEVKIYMDKNDKRPSKESKDEYIKNLGDWCGNQVYKNNKNEIVNQDDKKIWNEFINDEKYSKHFKEITFVDFETRLKKLMDYIDNNNMKPLRSDENLEIRTLANWSTKNHNFYIKNIFNNENYKKLWTILMKNEKYSKHFKERPIRLIKNGIEELKTFLDKNNFKPSPESKDIYIKDLGIWLKNQLYYYRKGIKNEENKKLWDELIHNIKYKQYFK